MANVKRRVKAPKSALKTVFKKKQTDGRTKKGLKVLQATIEVESTEIESNIEDPDIVKKRKADDNLLFLTPDEKVKYFLQNGHTLKDSFEVTTSVKAGRAKQIKMNKTAPVSNAYELSDPVKTKSGRLKNSKFKYINLVDNILQSKFSVMPDNNHKPTLKSAISSYNGVTNNNDTEITNQNNKTTSVNSKTNSQHSKTSDRSKKNASRVVSTVTSNTAPVVKKNSEKPRNNKHPVVLTHTTNEPKQSPTHGKDKPKKNQECEPSPTKTKQVALGNGVVLTLSLFECDYCNKTFNRKHSLVRHIYLHLGRKPHICPVCPKTFRILKNMKSHIDRDHCVHNVDETTETFSCDICDKPFLTKENLTLHLRSHIKGENTFKCIYCDKKFSYQLLLVQHEKKHLVTGKYQCTLCDMKYNSRDKLYVHVKSHLKLNDYICQYCGREFLRANSMKRHIQTMHVGRTIQCPVCNKKLKGHLTEHMRTHDKKRPHECPDCGKHFAQSTQLKVHRRGHTGSRPYICRICERPFSHSNALMLHLRRHTGEKPFPCAECPMSFSQLPHMKAHMSKIHGKENPYKCLKCQEYFKLKKDLLIHKKNCSGTGIDSDLYGDKGSCGDSSQDEDVEYVPAESTMTLSRMRFLLALLLTMIASKEKLKYLGFNKRLVDDLLVESLEAMDQTPCKDESISPLVRLRTNIETLLKGTVPKEQMEKFRKENKSTEELLELLTSEKEKQVSCWDWLSELPKANQIT